MKRKIAALLFVLALPLLATMPAGASANGPGPNCAHFGSNGNPSSPAYGGDQTSAGMVVLAQLNAPTCKNITYTATAYTTDGHKINSQSLQGNGTSTLRFQVVVSQNATPSQQICGTVTSSSDDGKVFDQIPSASSCQFVGGLLNLNGGIGQGGWT
jgi:hypothetical protein